MTLSILLALAGGFLLLVLGGELLVRGSVRLAERMGLSPLIIGLTLVGFGTSTPELVVSVQASLSGSPGIAIGNIVGSNIANILLILGVSALMFPITVGSNALRRDGGIVVGSALLFALIAAFGDLNRFVGALFVLMLVLYIAYAYVQEKSVEQAHSINHTAAYERGLAMEEVVPHQHQAHARSPGADVAIALSMVLGGLVVIIFGGRMFVEGAITLARAYGISETVIGLTIVAVGTSMPEFVTSVIAALRKHSDVALGNVLGSNIYNIFGIGGATLLIAPTTAPPQIISFDNPAMVAAALLLFAFAFTGRVISRREGLVLLACYAGYIAANWPR